MEGSPQRFVLDTSVIIDGKVPEVIEASRGRSVEVIVPLAVLDEIQAQASKGRESGFIGLDELKRLRSLLQAWDVKLRFVGDRPSLEDIRLARSGRIDALILDVARKEGGTLLTADYVQALVAEAEGIGARYLAPEVKTVGLAFEKYFTPDTLSIHLKENVPPMAKRGTPGKFELLRIDERPMTGEELEEIAREATEAARVSKEGFVEITRFGASVLQLGRYRIAITRPPFSDGLEVTIVRPIVQLRLEDYSLSARLKERFKEQAEGILIAGPPGSGKTTFAASLAEFYMKQGKIVKTLESPRDLQVSPEITQYGPLEGDFEKSADILLLVRPDYTVFDEIRKTKDFMIFADMRLAGVGMIGVVHASNPIDAIQRFIGRVELGMIPHIVDTVIFLRFGEVKKVYLLNLTVKVPTGMTEADLARPVVEIRDFETGRLEYEVYTFGEENVIIPVKEKGPQAPMQRLAEEKILEEVSRFDPDARVEVISADRAVVRVENEAIPYLIGKKGATISRLEEKLGIHLDVEPKTPSLGEEVEFDLRETGNSLDLQFEKEHIGKVANVYIDNDYLFSATIGKRSRIRVAKKSDIGESLIRSVIARKKIRVLV